MNVTTGGGAFMAKLEDAKALAQTITSVAQGAGVRCHSLVTDMDQPLGSAAGNAIEVQYALDYFQGVREPRMHEVVLALGALVLVDAGLAKDDADAKQKLMASAYSTNLLERTEGLYLTIPKLEIPALNAFLVASHINLVSLEAKNSLEDYFLQLTSTF